MKPPVYYFGSKAALAPWIIEHFPPRGSYHTYVEPFGGMAAVLLTLPLDKTVEIYNDLSEELTNFWDVLKDEKQTAELVRRLEYTPYSRVEFERALERYDKVGVDRAFAYAVLSQGANFPHRLSKDAKSRQWSAPIPGQRHSNQGKWPNLPGRVAECAIRFRNVVVEREDWRYILDRYDSPGTLFYVDPPYVLEGYRDERGNAGGYYTHTGSAMFTNRDQMRLLDALCAVRGTVVLSGYDVSMYREVLWKWTKDIKIFNLVGLNSKKLVREECVWIKAASRSLSIQDLPARAGRSSKGRSSSSTESSPPATATKKVSGRGVRNK